MLRHAMIAFSLLLTLFAGQSSVRADEINSEIDRLADRGLDFLTKSQGVDGTLSPRAGSGITSLAVTAALRHGRPLTDPLVSKGLKALEGCVRPDDSVLERSQPRGG